MALSISACPDAEGEKSSASGGGFSQIQSKSTGSGGASKKQKPALPDPSLWSTPLEDPSLEAGRLVWTGTCINCHSTGLGGAPLIGNRELWGPRIEKGLETLVEHATRGFYGKVGEMPARGGNESLSDEEVRSAVRFMASRAGEI